MIYDVYKYIRVTIGSFETEGNQIMNDTNEIAERKTRKMIPLKNAMFTWTPAAFGNPDCLVIWHPDYHDRGLRYSAGACYSWWTDKKTTTKDRKLNLMIKIYHMIARDGVPAEKVHAALSVIPEYLDMLSHDFSIYAGFKMKDYSK